jgi:hypothetical protein
MSLHAQRPGESVSVAKLGLYGTIGAGIITAVTSIVVGVLNHNSGPRDAVSTGPLPTTTVLSNEPRQDTGLRFSPIINGRLTVSGSAEKDVNGMYVLIGPKPSGGYDTGCGNVVDQRWQAEVPTDPSWQKYPLMTVPAYGSCPTVIAPAVDDATSATAFKFTFQGTDPTPPPPPPPPDQILNCAAQFGPSCFNGPGFGPPSVYQPNQ